MCQALVGRLFLALFPSLLPLLRRGQAFDEGGGSSVGPFMLRARLTFRKLLACSSSNRLLQPIFLGCHDLWFCRFAWLFGDAIKRARTRQTTGVGRVPSLGPRLARWGGAKRSGDKIWGHSLSSYCKCCATFIISLP